MRLRRGLLGLLGLVLLAAVVQRGSDAVAVGLCTPYKTWTTNEILTAADLNNSMVQAAQTNSTPQCVDRYSATVGQMQSTVDPYPAGSESQAASLAGELERLRYQLGKLIVGPNLGASGFWWYLRPIEGPRPTLLLNGSVEKWGAGAAVAPDGWTLTGASATTARNGAGAQVKIGNYSADVVRVGTDAYLGQIVTTPLVFPNAASAYWQSRTVTLAAWVRATVASRCRVGINDGVASTFSTYHTGGSAFELLTATRTVSGSATQLEARLQVDTGNTTCQFDGAWLGEGYLAAPFTPHPADRVVGARVYNSLDQSIGAGTTTAVSFDSERFDTSDLHGVAVCSAANDKCRLYAPVAGLYLATGHAVWASNATGFRILQIRLNGGLPLASDHRLATAGATSHSVATVTRLTATDYVDLAAWQNSGGSLNIVASANDSPEFTLTWIGP